MATASTRSRKQPTAPVRAGAASGTQQTRASIADCGPLLRIAVNAVGDTEEPPEWIELIPAGRFTGVDGRGPYANSMPDRVVAETKADMQRRGLTGGIPLDYDHATDFRERGPAPAAGWITDFKVEQGAIWGRIEWTPDGADHIRAKHWKYISPVFLHTDDAQRVVTCVLHAALTNDSNLRLTAVAAAADRRTDMQLPRGISKAAFAQAVTMASEGAPLSEIARTVEKAFPNLQRAQVAQLIEFIERLEGEPDNPEATEEPHEPEVTTREGHAEGCTSETCDGECRQVMQAADEAMAAAHARALHQGDGEPTDEELATARAFVQRHRQLEAHQQATRRKETAPVKTTQQTTHQQDASDPKDALIKDLGAKVAQLQTAQARREAEAKVTGAMAFPNPRLSPSMKDWAIEYAMRDPAGFDAYLKSAPVIMAKTPDDLRQPPEKGTQAQLDAAVRAICANMGIKPEDYLKHVNDHKGTPGSMAAICAKQLGI